MEALCLSLIRKMRTGMIALRKVKRCSSALFGLAFFWKSKDWMMEARQKEAEMAGLWSFVRPRPGEDGHHGEEDQETNVKDKHSKLENGEE